MSQCSSPDRYIARKRTSAAIAPRIATPVPAAPAFARFFARGLIWFQRLPLLFAIRACPRNRCLWPLLPDPGIHPAEQGWRLRSGLRGLRLLSIPVVSRSCPATREARDRVALRANGSALSDVPGRPAWAPATRYLNIPRHRAHVG